MKFVLSHVFLRLLLLNRDQYYMSVLKEKKMRCIKAPTARGDATKLKQFIYLKFFHYNYFTSYTLRLTAGAFLKKQTVAVGNRIEK